MQDFDEIHRRFPFVSLAEFQDQRYIGIIQNQSQKFTSMYLLNSLKSTEEKLLFLQLGEAWWWGSNRSLPISVFLKDEFTRFRYAMRVFPTKNFNVLIGPVINIQKLAKSNIKRKTINLEKKNRNSQISQR